ncbi:MAG: hypothetical protein IJO29_02360 [Oscillospiraceae bacterium]|nr:hypothetical protein [Oscillospiraceae bacterium]
MIEKKFNLKVYFFILLFALILPLAAKVVYMLLSGQVTYENNEKVPFVLAAVISVLTILVCSTYALSLITLLKQVICHKNSAFKLDENGIYDTVCAVMFLAFVIVVPIKHIPFSSVTYTDSDEDSIYIRMKTKEVNAGRTAKIILAIMGYHFCYSFTSKKLTEDEIITISGLCKNCID